MFVLLAVAGPAAEAQTRPADFGKQWVRSHPFMISGLNQRAVHLDVDEYRAAGLNTLSAWWDSTAAQTAIAAAGDLPWHAHVETRYGLARALNKIDQIGQSAGGTGWLIQDEPPLEELPRVAEAIDYVKQNYPGMLAYTNVDNWSNFYLDRLIETVGPDLLMFDRYPFTEDRPVKLTQYYVPLMAIRAKALVHDMPYWTYIQAFEDNSRRLPSESELRMQVFTSLTAGYTGISYFGYQFRPDEFTGMHDPAGHPTALYEDAARLGPEIESLGQSLRFLTSTDLRYVPGRAVYPGGELDNRTPRVLTAWSEQAGGDPHLVAVGIDHSAPDSLGREKNGLIGFFRDDQDQAYFMITNETQRIDASAAATSLTFFIDFDDTIDQLLMLNRLTGLAEVVPLKDHRLTVILPGGTGNLYKYDTGPFAGLPVPEPTALGLLLLAGWVSCGASRRSGRLQVAAHGRRSC